mmetsp:Transcript_3641/g.10390  ORF Transcript_3641/g.10390 Transcript_3641/m.10390 type:complete len:223 (+) Transcript_3641:914-1582(+)
MLRVICIDIKCRRPLLRLWVGVAAARDGRFMCLALAPGMGRSIGLALARLQNYARGWINQTKSSRANVGRLARPHGHDDVLRDAAAALAHVPPLALRSKRIPPVCYGLQSRHRALRAIGIVDRVCVAHFALFWTEECRKIIGRLLRSRARALPGGLDRQRQPELPQLFNNNTCTGVLRRRGAHVALRDSGADEHGTGPAVDLEPPACFRIGGLHRLAEQTGI